MHSTQNNDDQLQNPAIQNEDGDKKDILGNVWPHFVMAGVNKFTENIKTENEKELAHDELLIKQEMLAIDEVKLEPESLDYVGTSFGKESHLLAIPEAGLSEAACDETDTILSTQPRPGEITVLKFFLD